MRVRIAGSLLALTAACADRPQAAADDWQFSGDSDGKADASSACTITAPPSALHLDPFYTKYCDADGIPIVTSRDTPDAALHQAQRLTLALLAPNQDVRDAFVAQHLHLMVLGTAEQTLDLPEERGQPETLDTRARGIFNPGPPPNAFAAEENLLCYERDGWHGENIWVHEFGHAIEIAGFESIDPQYGTAVKAAYTAAIAAGKYENKYAGTNAEEYWAEGLQDYFNVHQTWDPTDVNTRDQLAAYDPTLYSLIDTKFRAVHLPRTCPVPGFSASQWYRVENVATGRALDDNQLKPAGNFSGQYWHIAPAGDGTFRLTNMHLGSGKSLDVTDMNDTGNYSGQIWRITPTTRGEWRLSNTYQPDRSLAASGDALASAPSADDPTQAWTIHRIP